MAETMIERVARRLCEREGGDPDKIRQGEGKAAGQSWTGWQAYASDAEAIIAAMREPTAEMAVIGGNGKHMDSGDMWRAMIDAARGVA